MLMRERRHTNGNGSSSEDTITDQADQTLVSKGAMRRFDAKCFRSKRGLLLFSTVTLLVCLAMMGVLLVLSRAGHQQQQEQEQQQQQPQCPPVAPMVVPVQQECPSEAAEPPAWHPKEGQLMPTFPYRLCRALGAQDVAPFRKEPLSCVRRSSSNKIECTYATPSLAFLVPFVPGQIDTLESSIRMWSHPDLFPCRRNKHTPASPSSVDLVFQLTDSFLDHPELRRRLEEALQPIQECFGRVRFLSMNLDEAQNQYDKNRFSPSPSTMFHSVFGVEEMVRSYTHFFLMEPDVRPVRSGWADRLVVEVLLDGIDFWQKGSIEYNHPHADHHINGNGLYRLGDPGYNCFLDSALAVRYPDSFDQGQFFVFNQVDKKHNTHRSIKSTYLMNVQDAYYEGFEEEQPDTFLVHGKVVVTQLEEKYSNWTRVEKS